MSPGNGAGSEPNVKALYCLLGRINAYLLGGSATPGYPTPWASGAARAGSARSLTRTPTPTEYGNYAGRVSRGQPTILCKQRTEHRNPGRPRLTLTLACTSVMGCGSVEGMTFRLLGDVPGGHAASSWACW